MDAAPIGSVARDSLLGRLPSRGLSVGLRTTADNVGDVENACQQIRGEPPFPGKPTPAEQDPEIAHLVHGDMLERASILRSEIIARVPC